MRLILLVLLTLNLLHAQKIALLIGNDDYSFQPLSNPLNDVDGIYRTLKEIGFDISEKDVLKNVSQNTMQNALADFSQRAKDAEIALIYFSGHGMQVNNTNYMLPAKTNPQKPVDLFGLVNLDYMIQSATSAKYGIVLVDACRDNPLVKYFQNGKHKGTSAKKGLGQVTPTTGQVVIGFATSAGDTADDGGGKMSPYAEALSVRLKEPNKDITKVLGLVALDVSAKYDQNPILRTNLAYDVYLYGVQEKVNREPQPPVIITPVVYSLPPSTTSNWITPKDSVCINNGGEIKHGSCEANWYNAKKICRFSGGKLPELTDFRKAEIDRKNSLATNDNKDFDNLRRLKKSYFKKRGFRTDKDYWSLNTGPNGQSASCDMLNIPYYVFSDRKDDYLYVRCMKSE